jgi:hypothetical protein
VYIKSHHSTPNILLTIFLSTPNFAACCRLYHIERLVDIDVSLHSTITVRPSILDDIKSFQAKIIKECSSVRPEILHERIGHHMLKKFLFRENYRTYIPKDMHHEATQLRNSLTKTLVVEVFPKLGTKPAWSSLDEEVRRHCFHHDIEVVYQEANAISELLDSIRSFLQKHRNVPVPVVLILCNISWIGKKPFLSSVCDDPVALEDITLLVYIESEKVNDRCCKLVVSCKSQFGPQLYTNALHTYVSKACLFELQTYVKSLVSL